MELLSIRNNSLKAFKKTFPEKIEKRRNDTNAKCPQMSTYKMIAVSAEEATSGGRTKSGGR